MNLRFVWQIFRKDAQRLWWIIALTILLLYRLAHEDSWRAGATPDSSEGWLNIVLPLAWSFLIALVVLEDSVAGESPFWVTVPCRWPSLLAAKASFILVFVHIPYLVACAAIVQGRGFAPADYLTVLFGKQLSLLVLTLAGLALATMVGNVTRFMIVAIVLATAVGAPALPESAYFSDGVATRLLREIVLFSLSTTSALVIVIFQYRSRRTVTARLAGGAALTIACVIWLLPRESFDWLRAAVSPATVALPSIQIANSSQSGGGQIYVAPGSVQIAIPLTVSPAPDGYGERFQQSEVAIREPDGHRHTAQTALAAFLAQTFRGVGPIVGDLDFSANRPKFQVFAIDRSIMNRIRDEPVTIEASALVSYYRQTNAVWTSLDKSRAVAGAGRCLAEIVGDNPTNEVLRVGCESPGTLPSVQVRITDAQRSRSWDRTLGDSRGLPDYPVNTWLSPVDRAEEFFAVTDEERFDPRNGSTRSTIPRELVQSLRVAITPEIPAGSAMVHYELPGIRPGQYEVKR